jgi:iron complex outermembrane recepter protein
LFLKTYKKYKGEQEMKRKIAILCATLVVSMSLMAEERVERLEESVITAEGFETTVKETSKNITVVTKEEIEKSGSKNIYDILKNVPGVNIINTSSGYFIDMRGQGERAKYNVALLIDGININPIDVHSSAPLHAISLNDIERIEVIQGSGSVLYGNGAAGGVVNVITKSGNAEKNFGNVTLGYGSYNDLNYGVDSGIGFGNIMLTLGVFGNDKKGYRDDQEKSTLNINTGIRYKINENHSIKIKYLNYSGKEDFVNMLTKNQMDEDRKQSGYADGAKQSNAEENHNEYKLEYSGKINEEIGISANAFYLQQEKKNNDGDTLNSIFSDNRYGVGLKTKFEYTKNSNIVAGYDFSNMTGKRDYRHMLTIYNPYEMEFEKKVNTLFLTNKNKISKFEITEGIRYEKADYTLVRNIVNVKTGIPDKLNVNRDADNTAFDIGVNWLYSDNGNGYIRYEKGYVSPSGNQMLEKKQDMTYAINSNLKSEKHDTFEIGFKDYLLDFMYVSGTLFMTNSQDEIIIERKYGSSMSSPYTYINIDKSEKKGGELFAEQYLGKITLNQKYAYVDSEMAEGANKGKKIPFVPQNIVSAEVKYEIVEGLQLAYKIEYRDNVFIESENKDELKLPSYALSNVRAEYKIGNFVIDAGINNLFNRKYSDNMNYSSSMKTTTYSPAPEINYFSNIRYSF